MLQSGLRPVTVPFRCVAFLFAIFLLALAGASTAAGQGRPKKKASKDPPTQTLPLLPDPPSAVSAETARLVFHVSTLSAKGLLSPQTEDAIRELMQAGRGGRFVQLRAFGAGTGDARRVREIVSEIFANKKQPLPALVTIQVGALPLEGAQVAIESVSETKDKKPENPRGLAFFAAQHGKDAAEALDRLASAARSASIAPSDMLRVTCLLGPGTALSDAEPADASRHFPAASVNLAQRLREGSDVSADCEGIARASEASGAAAARQSGVALVNTPKLVFSGSQMAFQQSEPELRLAFERLEKSLEAAGASYRDAVFAHFYPLGRSVDQKLPALEMEFFRRPVPATALIFEGLPSPDASLAIDVVAAIGTGAAPN